MDPASAIIGIASGAAGLVAITAQVVTFLAGLKDAHRNVRVMALDLSSTCRAYKAAWTRIHDWARTVDGSGSAASATSYIEELRNFLDDGETIVGWIKEDLDRLSSSGQLSWWRSNATRPRKQTALVVIHEKNVREHIERLSRQIINLNVIISTMNL